MKGGGSLFDRKLKEVLLVEWLTIDEWQEEGGRDQTNEGATARCGVAANCREGGGFGGGP